MLRWLGGRRWRNVRQRHSIIVIQRFRRRPIDCAGCGKIVPLLITLERFGEFSAWLAVQRTGVSALRLQLLLYRARQFIGRRNTGKQHHDEEQPNAHSKF